MTAEELWARSYAQFVVTMSGLERLRASLDALRRRESGDVALGAVYFPRQWDDDDFVEIGNAIEDLFRRLGWII